MIDVAVTGLVGAAAAAGAMALAQRRAKAAQFEAVKQRKALGLAAVEAEREAGLSAAEAQAKARRRRLEASLDEREQAVVAEEPRVERAEGNLSARVEVITAREAAIDGGYDAIRDRRKAARDLGREAKRTDGRIVEVLEQAAGHTRDEAIETLRERLGQRAAVAAQRAAKLLEERTEADREQMARRLIDVACQRYGSPQPAKRLITNVLLPKSDKLKARLVADDHGVLKAITEITEVSFEPQEGGKFHLRAPNPYQREVGRLAYERMVRGGMVTEAVAKKAAHKAAQDLEKTVRDAGRRAAKLLRIKGMHPEILHLVGKLLYRTSYTQNQWQHAIETSFLCSMIAENLGLNVAEARRSALIHDIGKVLWVETEATGSHAVSGAKFATDHGEAPEIVHPVAAHHNDEPPSTPLAHLVAASDALSGARPGARRETIESFSERVEALEMICQAFGEVQKASIMSGGREVRIRVDPRAVDDLGAMELSEDLAGRIEDELTFPGQIKVTVERETVAQAVARRAR